MVRKFMLDSLEFLTKEYNFSGYRFDLMELHDVETMIQIEDMLQEIDPTIVVYGEPWSGGTSPETYENAGKDNLHKIGTVEIGRASCRKSVDLGGRCIIKKKKIEIQKNE